MQIDSKHNQGKQKTFDPSFLRDKYKEERDKRLRPDGNDQYEEVKGDFSYFIEDPYIENEIKRDPLEDGIISFILLSISIAKRTLFAKALKQDSIMW